MIFVIIIVSILLFTSIIYLIKIGATTEHFYYAFFEVIIIYIFSNLPTLFLLLVFTDKGFTEIINSGEILIYISAILAPVVWTFIAYSKESFRAITATNIVIIIILYFFIGFFFLALSTNDNEWLESLPLGFVEKSSYIIYFVSLLMWFIATVYTKFINNYEPTKRNNSVLSGLRGEK